MKLTTEFLSNRIKEVCEGHIMVVEDEASNLKLISKILQLGGFTDVTLLDDPRTVLRSYQIKRPDLILLDINMPFFDGFEVMEQLNELDDPLLPPIIILTAQHNQEFLHRALSEGARDYITKPFNKNELLMRVTNLLQAYLSHKLLHDQAAMLENMVKIRTEKLHKTRLEIIQRLGKAAEYRDEETGNHIMRMSHCCARLAKKIGWNSNDCELILHASPMHDLGKIGIPDVILLKPGRLDKEEWEIMKTHTIIGAQLLEGGSFNVLSLAREIALTHHEKWDGTGYPNQLKGEDIPLAGRITAICDVFDALLSDRPYKKGWSLDEAKKFLIAQKGLHFDPYLVDKFFEILPDILNQRSRFLDH